MQQQELDESTELSEDEDDPDHPVNTAGIQPLSTIGMKILFFLFLWQSFFRVSETALKFLLKFLKYLIKVISITYQCLSIQSVSDETPLTIEKAEKLLKINENGVIQYVVCPKCHSVYLFADCIEIKSNGKRESKLCRHVKYPHHPHQSKWGACMTTLLNESSSNKKRFIPHLIYSYLPIHISMQRLALKPGFLRACEKWREREQLIPMDTLGDIYDGRVCVLF